MADLLVGINISLKIVIVTSFLNGFKKKTHFNMFVVIYFIINYLMTVKFINNKAIKAF